METNVPRYPGTKVYLSKAEMMSFATTLVECALQGGGSATGSGFFFEYFRGNSNGKSLTVIVTNRHVVEDSVGGSFRITLANDKGMPDVGNSLQVPLPKPGQKVGWILHPNPEVDLAILPIGTIIEYAHRRGVLPYISTLTAQDIATADDLRLVAQMEPVAMPGYPQGIWDSINNQPIFRRGFCATHPAVPYNGKPEFLVDIECHPGSSGSPVLLFDTGNWQDKWGDSHDGGRIKLVGILYAGFIQTAHGEVVEMPIPTSSSLMATVQVPIGLAKCVSASQLSEFEALLPPPP